MADIISREYPYHRKAVRGWINYDEELNRARRWVAERTDHFYKQLADFYHCGAPTVLTVNKDMPSGELAGTTVSINNIPLSRSVFDGKFFSGSEVTVRADDGGQPVKGWQIVQVNNDGSQTETIVGGSQYDFTMPACRSLTVNMLRDASAIQPAVAADSRSDDWYTIDGRRLNSRPQRRGLYINRGRKVIVK